jgi:hypothetical protein
VELTVSFSRRILFHGVSWSGGGSVGRLVWCGQVKSGQVRLVGWLVGWWVGGKNVGWPSFVRPHLVPC